VGNSETIWSGIAGAGLAIRRGVAVLFLAAASMAGGCDAEDGVGPSGAGGAGYQAMEFSIDEALLGRSRAFDEFGVIVRAPAGWEALAEEEVARVSAALRTAAKPGEGSEEMAAPLAVYMNMPEQSALIVSSVPLGTGDAEVEAYREALREQFGEVQEGRFRVNGLEVQQYLVQPEGMVNFKLLVSAENAAAGDFGRRLQLDYVVPQAAWPSQVRAVESSIGSLRRVRR
jgi:hypothetical protein